mgnify:CR=1 FL=1
MLDAESHLGIQRVIPPRGVTPQYLVRFELAMTDKKTVDFIASLLPQPRRVAIGAKGRRLPYYKVRLFKRHLLDLLKQIRPYVQGKARQVDLIFELEKLRRRCTPPKEHYGKAKFLRMPAEFHQPADVIYREFRSLQLNKKPRRKAAGKEV